MRAQRRGSGDGKHVPQSRSASTIPPVYDWTEFYVGINGGGSWIGPGRHQRQCNGVTVSSGLFGGTIGYNAQNLGRFVVGEELAFDWRSINAGIPAASCVLNCEFKSQWLAAGLRETSPVAGRLRQQAGRCARRGRRRFQQRPS
jgi:hypothetical protein